MAGRSDHRGFGRLRKLLSKLYQGSCIGPDLARHCRARTLFTRGDVEAFLAAGQRLISMGSGRIRSSSRDGEPMTFGPFVEPWVGVRYVMRDP